jgi:hypothetical protein
LSKNEKDQFLLELKKDIVPANYISNAWNKTKLPFENAQDVTCVMTKPWVVGFIEGEGSFYLVSKDKTRIVAPISPNIGHLKANSNNEEIKEVITKAWLVGFVEAAGNFVILENYGRFKTEFKIYLHQDVFLLYLIKRVLHIKNNIKFNKNINMFSLSTNNSRSISNIIESFKNKFKGMKSLEFKLWQKANYYKDKNSKKFLKLSDISLKVRDNSSVPFVNKRHFSFVANTKFATSKKPFYLSKDLIKDQSNLTSNFNLRNYSTKSNSINPVVTYLNADTLKLQIIKENKKKSGIYRWTNLINGKSYIALY